jgi:N-acetylneuraminic acid mutarotase
LLTLSLLVTLGNLQSPNIQSPGWKQLPPLPDPEGFAAPFAGMSHNQLLVAGGANFPDKKPWEGGTKVWYDMVFALDTNTSKWSVVGTLPRPLGYGISTSYENQLICIGGSDSKQHYSDAFTLEIINQHLVTRSFPSLPMNLANACGTLVGSRLIVAGGQEKPDSTSASERVFEINLAAKSPTWKELPKLPCGGRILATAATLNGNFWVIGGASLAPDTQGKAVRTYHNDSYRFDGKQWHREANLPFPVVAAPSPAPSNRQGIFLLGGDDGSWVGKPPQNHPGFANSILRYDPTRKSWEREGSIPAPRVTVPTVRWGLEWIIPNGEQKPGIRSNEVWQFTPKN